MPLRPIAARPADREGVGAAVLAEYESLLLAEAGRWVAEVARGEAARLESGEVRAALWIVGRSEPGGLAVWDFVRGVGRRVRLYLARGHRTPDALATLLDELDARSEHDGPIASVADFVPGYPGGLPPEVFTDRGYFPVERLALHLPAETPLPDETLVGRPDLRPLDSGDREALVELMRSAYDQLAGTPSPWLVYRDPTQDARDAVEEILEDRRGDWLDWASFGVDVAGVLRGASLVTRLDVPVLSEVMVAPELRGIGLGYHLTLESVRALREREAGEPHLVTTSHDLRAIRLFRRVGFEPAERPAVGLWVSRVAVGVPLPERDAR